MFLPITSSEKRIDQHKCECGSVAKRDPKDYETIAPVGITSISHATAGKGSVAKTGEFAFGRFKRNPDGTVDKNHRPFRDTGEMERYMQGANDLGTPKIDDDGNVIRRKDGSVVRNGAKLVQYSPNRTPSRHDVKKARFRPPPNIVTGSGWVGDGEARQAVGSKSGMSQSEMKQAEIPSHKWTSPKRRAR